MQLENIEVVLFDLDGTVYYGSKIIPGANDTIKFFRDAGKKIYFTTNNSTKSRHQIFDKLTGMGIDCKFEEVITSGYLAALYAKKNKLTDMFIFGSENLKEEFNELGVSISQNEDAENLLIGYNPNMTYEGLTTAMQVAIHARNIIACNKERLFPGENSKLMPGCGAMTAPIEWCANRSCDVVIGKPNTLMVDLLAEREDKSPENFLVIGDTYESDIAMAWRARCNSILISDVEKKNVITVKTIKDVPSCF